MYDWKFRVTKVILQGREAGFPREKNPKKPMLLNTGGSYYYDIFGKTATCTTTIVSLKSSTPFC
jgi:hypothetical protein